MWMVVLSGLFAAVLIADVIMGFWQCSIGVGRICCLSHAYFLALCTFLLFVWSLYSAYIFSKAQSYTCNQELVLFGFSATVSFLVVGFSCLVICLIQLSFTVSNTNTEKSNAKNDEKKDAKE